MKKNVLLLLFVLFTGFTYAQDNKIDMIVKRASKPFTENSSFSINFTLKSLAGTEKGVIYVNGDKYRIDTEAFQMIYDGHKRYSYIKDNNEVYVEDQTNDGAILETPQRMLRLAENSTPTLKLNDNGTKTLYYEKEELIVNIDALGEISSIKVQPDSESKIVIYLNVIDLKTDINSSLFIFDISKYNNVEVIDLS